MTEQHAEMAKSLIEQMTMTHRVMLSCAINNARVFNRDAPATTSYGFVMRSGFARYSVYPKLPKGVRQRKPKQCYSNATDLVVRDRMRFIYCEGFAVHAGLGLVLGSHAWVLDSENDYRVVDPTWRDVAPGAYLGVPFPYEYLFAKINESGYYGMLDNMGMGCIPLDDPDFVPEAIPIEEDFAHAEPAFVPIPEMMFR